MTAQQHAAPGFLTIAHIREAHDRIRDKVRRTPVFTSTTLDGLTGANLFFKCENFQTIGAFKARGAANAVFSLPDADARRGVATHSSGNHAAALARAARLRGIRAYIVMPDTAPKAKVASVERNGGSIVFCAPTLEARQTTAARLIEDTGAIFVHPYDDPTVMAGQGTAALELLEEIEALDAVICPVGGGGLISGTATVVKSLHPEARVFGAEPEGADDACRSLAAGRVLAAASPRSIADGLLGSLSERTFAVIRARVDGIVTVSDPEIIRAMRLTWEIMKMIIEPSAAVPIAALLQRRAEFQGRRVGVIVSGGNLDLDTLPWQERPV